MDVSEGRRDEVLSMLANIRTSIKELEEKFIPIGLVHGRTYQGLKNRIHYMTKALHHGPGYEHLTFDLSSSHAKFINDIELVKVHYTPARKVLVYGGRLLSIGSQPLHNLPGWTLISNRNRWWRSPRDLQSSSAARSYESNTGC